MNDRETKRRCDPWDIAIKSLFLGPQSENGAWFREMVGEVLAHTIRWRQEQFPGDGRAISVDDMSEDEFKVQRGHMAARLHELLSALESETPKFTPRYIGHMVSELSLPSLLAEFAMLLHNPNNASREASRVGLNIEREAIADLATMIGYDGKRARGHFTSGGTVANFEAVWRAVHRFDSRSARALALIDRGLATRASYFRLCHDPSPFPIPASEEDDLEVGRHSILRRGAWAVGSQRGHRGISDGPILLVPGNKHYSWPKAAALFGIGSDNAWTIALDPEGRMDVSDLRRKIEVARSCQRPILAVVSVAGTTELGEIDPVDEVQDVLDEYRAEGLTFWHHVDAAYGGFFAAIRGADAGLSGRVRRALGSLSRADSVTLDPHKLGYVPYSCGAFLAKDGECYSSPRIDAPYLQASGDESAGWATTLEGSRSAAGAAAVWLTSRSTPLTSDGFGRVLSKTIEARALFAQKLAGIDEVKLLSPIDTNIVCFVAAKPSEKLACVNQRTRELYDRIEKGPEFSVSRTELSRRNYGPMIERLCREWKIVDDKTSDLFVIRLVLMNPFIASREMSTDLASEFVEVIQGFLRSEET